MEQSNLTHVEIEQVLQLCLENIKIVPDERVRSHLTQARTIMEKIDSKDAPHCGLCHGYEP